MPPQWNAVFALGIQWRDKVPALHRKQEGVPVLVSSLRLGHLGRAAANDRPDCPQHPADERHRSAPGRFVEAERAVCSVPTLRRTMQEATPHGERPGRIARRTETPLASETNR